MEKFTFGLFIGFELAEMGVDGLPWTKAMKWEVQGYILERTVFGLLEQEMCTKEKKLNRQYKDGRET